MLGRKRPTDEWKELQNDILTFCKVLRFQPSHDQENYLLRVQNGSTRLGMSEDNGFEMGEVIYTCMIWRALCHAQPSICVVGRPSVGAAWVEFTRLWIGRGADVFRGYFKVSSSGRFLQTSSGVHVCHVVGPWLSDLSGYTPGTVDVLLGDFEWTAPAVHERAMRLGRGSLIYLPVPRNHGYLDSPHDKRKNGPRSRSYGADSQGRDEDPGTMDISD